MMVGLMKYLQYPPTSSPEQGQALLLQGLHAERDLRQVVIHMQPVPNELAFVHAVEGYAQGEYAMQISGSTRHHSAEGHALRHCPRDEVSLFKCEAGVG